MEPATAFKLVISILSHADQLVSAAKKASEVISNAAEAGREVTRDELMQAAGDSQTAIDALDQAITAVEDEQEP